ncbi:PA14 domain protein [Paenibacillus curdlanolyticus YK9]|uniref:PA14 domain protein n=1 Tax=Paenibacillus curdlanolyticus YK9 TaxID=717606 RepID=E0IEB6_9BACL|nr:PA14 domain-containing protein [Paenibacillus curdlanolyticus]EFM09004.1 PA14 domain protein [Paenibacillus curdlanolyticus YK9]
MRKFIKTKGVIALVCLLTAILVQATSAAASTTLFSQGQGYAQGAYDLNAQQPLATSWNRNSRFAGVNANLNTKWTYAIGNTNYSPTIGADGTIYIANMASSSSQLYALNPDGSLKWSNSTQYAATTSPIIGQDGTIYVGAGQRLVAINSNGADVFTSLIGKPISGIAIDHNGNLIISCRNGYILSFNPTQQSIQWTTYLNVNDLSAPAIAEDGTIFAQAMDGRIEIIALHADGTSYWRNTLSTKLSTATESIYYTAPPIDKYGNVYAIGRNEAILYSVGHDGTLNWTYPVGDLVFTFPVIDEQRETIYIGNSNAQAEFTALNMDGTVKWKLNTGVSIYTTPIVDSQGLIYFWGPAAIKVVTPEGSLKSSYNTVGRFDLSIGSDGTLYMSDGPTGMLRAIGGTIDNLTPPSAQQGLQAEYFNNEDLTDLKTTRVDQQIDFNWGMTVPDALIDPETYSVRWTGKIQPLYTDTYNFHALTDDGVRLWIDGQLIIDRWQTNSVSEFTGTIALVAGQKYDIKMEYFNGPRNGFVQLQWSSQSQAKEVIPANAFTLN